MCVRVCAQSEGATKAPRFRALVLTLLLRNPSQILSLFSGAGLSLFRTCACSVARHHGRAELQSMPRSLAYSRRALVPHLLRRASPRVACVARQTGERDHRIMEGLRDAGQAFAPQAPLHYRSPSGALGPRRLASRGEGKRRGHDGRFATSMTRASSSSSSERKGSSRGGSLNFDASSGARRRHDGGSSAAAAVDLAPLDNLGPQSAQTRAQCTPTSLMVRSPAHVKRSSLLLTRVFSSSL